MLQKKGVTLQRQGGTLQRQGGTLQRQGGTLQRNSGMLQRNGGMLQRKIRNLQKNGGTNHLNNVVLQILKTNPLRTEFHRKAPQMSPDFAQFF